MRFKNYDIRGDYSQNSDFKLISRIPKALKNIKNIKNIAIAYDMRQDSTIIASKLIEESLKIDLKVVYLGMCSTPMVFFANSHLNLDASLIITGSHLESSNNGIKIMTKNSIPLHSKNGLKELEKEILNKNLSPKNTKKEMTTFDIAEKYFEKISSFIHFKKKFTIVTDYAYGLGSIELSGLYKYCKIISLNENINFYGKSTPKENIKKTIRELNANFGVQLDSDADRITFYDEKGKKISPNIISCILIEYFLKKFPTKKDEKALNIGYTMPMSKNVIRTINKNGGIATLVSSGNAFMKEEMHKKNLFFSSQLSGHFCYKNMNYSESPSLTIVFIMTILEENNIPLSELAKKYSHYSHSDELSLKINVTPKKIFNLIKKTFKHYKISNLDNGIFLETKSFWFSLRISGSENNVLRLTFEALKKNIMLEKKKKILSLIETFMKNEKL